MYQPTNPPDPLDPVQAWLMREFMAISRYLSGPQDYVTLAVLHKEPPKPREGMTVNADGTDWNPGAGAGRYQYLGGAWVNF